MKFLLLSLKELKEFILNFYKPCNWLYFEKLGDVQSSKAWELLLYTDTCNGKHLAVSEECSALQSPPGQADNTPNKSTSAKNSKKSPGLTGLAFIKYWWVSWVNPVHIKTFNTSWTRLSASFFLIFFRLTTARRVQRAPLKFGNFPNRATSTLQWGHAVRYHVRVLAAINDTTSSIDVFSMVDERARGSDERSLAAALQRQQLVVRRQHVVAACGIIDSSHDTHTTANDASSLQSWSLELFQLFGARWTLLAVNTWPVPPISN